MTETKSNLREVWVKVQDNAIHKVTICQETACGIIVEDWTGGIPIHYTVKAENILGEQAPDERIKELEQGKRMHRVVVSKPIADNGCFFVPNTTPTIKQLYGDEEIEQIIKDRDIYKRALQIAEELGELCAPASSYIEQAKKEYKNKEN